MASNMRRHFSLKNLVLFRVSEISISNSASLQDMNIYYCLRFQSASNMRRHISLKNRVLFRVPEISISNSASLQDMNIYYCLRFQSASNMRRHISRKNRVLFRVSEISISKIKSTRKFFWVQSAVEFYESCARVTTIKWFCRFYEWIC